MLRHMHPESARNQLASHWNASEWFGIQLGGTAWLLGGALVVASQSPSSSVVLFACGLASNAVGCLLWVHRARLDPYRAVQVLGSVIVVAGAFATRWLELRDEFAFLHQRLRPGTMYLLLAVCWLVLITRCESSRRAARKGTAA
jgi:hypothetical protein